MRKESGPLPILISSILVVAVLITLVVPGGWVVWVPVLLALAVVATIWTGLSR